MVRLELTFLALGGGTNLLFSLDRRLVLVRTLTNRGGRDVVGDARRTLVERRECGNAERVADMYSAVVFSMDWLSR